MGSFQENNLNRSSPPLLERELSRNALREWSAAMNLFRVDADTHLKALHGTTHRSRWHIGGAVSREGSTSMHISHPRCVETQLALETCEVGKHVGPWEWWVRGRSPRMSSCMQKQQLQSQWNGTKHLVFKSWTLFHLLMHLTEAFIKRSFTVFHQFIRSLGIELLWVTSAVQFN